MLRDAYGDGSSEKGQGCLGSGGDKAEGTPSCLLLLSSQGSAAGSGQIWGESCSSKKACSQTLGGTS